MKKIMSGYKRDGNNLIAYYKGEKVLIPISSDSFSDNIELFIECKDGSTGRAMSGELKPYLMNRNGANK